jgi:hypothetical protein
MYDSVFSTFNKAGTKKRSRTSTARIANCRTMVENIRSALMITLTNLMIHTVLLEKLITPQLAKNFRAFYGTRSFMTNFITVYH